MIPDGESSFPQTCQGLLSPNIQSPPSHSTVIWKKSFPYIPAQVLVSNEGKYVIMWGNWYRLPPRYPISIYKEDGAIVRQLSFDDLFKETNTEPPRQLRPDEHIMVSGNGVVNPWAPQINDVKIDDSVDRLSFLLQKGKNGLDYSKQQSWNEPGDSKKVTIDLSTGKLL